jgi:peroxiredoxin
MRTLLFLLLLACGPPAYDPNALPAVDDFALIDHQGGSFKLSRHADASAVVLYVYAAGCPIARQQLGDLADLAKRFDTVKFLLLDASPQDTAASVREEAEQFDIPFPILIDDRQLVAEALDVRRTGEAIVLDPAHRRLVWRGPIDDRMDYGGQREQAQHAWLADALTRLVNQQAVEPNTAEVRGCAVSLPRSKAERAATGAPTPTFTQDVAPILHDRCQVCHRPSGIAPWAMTSYEVVRGWAPMMREVIRTRRMPPWHADPWGPAFNHDLSLTPDQAATLVHWAEEGTPRGDGEDPFVRDGVPDQPDWPLGTPDILLTLPERKVPATGQVPYWRPHLALPITEPTWIRAAHVVPGNRKILHHALVFQVDAAHQNKRRDPNDDDELSIWQDLLFSAFVPGMEAGDPFPAGTGRLLMPGDELQLTVHYAPDGRKEVDQTRIGLYIAHEPPAAQFRVHAVANQDFRIPPGARAFPVQAEWVAPEPMMLLRVFPHMHLRGDTFTLEVVTPDGARQTVTRLPSYDFNWQRWYELTEPLFVPAGSRVICSGTFDNSAMNPNNPDPSAAVRQGLQTTNEMFVGYVAWRSATAAEATTPR